MSELSKVKEAAAFIRDLSGDFQANKAIIISSRKIDCDVIKAFNYSEIPNYPVPIDSEGLFCLCQIDGVNCYLLKGRVHSFEGYEPQEVIRPVRILKELGVTEIIITTSAGAVNHEFEPGELMLITDHVNFSGDNPLKGRESREFGNCLIDMTNAYSSRLQDTFRNTALSLEIPLNEGIYMKFAGPSYETPAEVRIARSVGADVVGFSTVYECIAAVQCGLEVAGIACINHMAAGIQSDYDDIDSVNEECNVQLSSLISGVIKSL